MIVFRHLDEPPLLFGVFRLWEAAVAAVALPVGFLTIGLLYTAIVELVLVAFFAVTKRLDPIHIAHFLFVKPFLPRRLGVKVGATGAILAVLLLGCSASVPRRYTPVSQVEAPRVESEDDGYVRALLALREAMTKETMPVEILPAAGPAKIEVYIAPDYSRRYFLLEGGSAQ